MNKQELINLAKQKLNAIEMAIFQLMVPQAGVVFLKGKPGTAKSAVLESIANKLNMVYIRMDLTTKDEVDIGLYPYLQQTEKGYSTVAHAVPDWAEMTLDTTRNYMIVFEEINRAKKDIMNAALGLLNEKRIGHSFAFKSNVFMAAAGNIGEQDGTDVEELDIAQSSRLINYPWEMDLMKWKEMYADANVHPDIVKFLEHKPTAYHPAVNDQADGVHVCPRTWTNLSKLIVEFHGMDSSIEDYGHLLQASGKYHVGVFAQQMYSYMIDSSRLTVKKLLKGQYKDLSKVSRENRMEVAGEINAINLTTLKDKEVLRIKDLVMSFKKTQDEDALVGTLYEMAYSQHVQGLGPNTPDYDKYRGVLRTIFLPEFEREKALVLKKAAEPKIEENAK